MPMTVTVSLKTPGSVDGCIWCKVHALLLQAVKGAGSCGEAGAWQDTLAGGHEGGHCREIRRSGLLEHASRGCGFLHAGSHDHPAGQHFPAFAPLCNAASVRCSWGHLVLLRGRIALDGSLRHCILSAICVVPDQFTSTGVFHSESWQRCLGLGHWDVGSPHIKLGFALRVIHQA